MDISGLTTTIVDVYTGFLNSLPPFFQSFLNLFFLAISVFIYVVFIWKLHRFISRKNILKLNLSQYNTTRHPAVAKIVATALYFLEYLVILPFIIFFWFSIFSVFLIFFTKLPISTILIISAVIVAAIRITAYYKQSTARELAKLLPLNLLAALLLTGGLFNFENVISNLSQIPVVLNTILNYLLFVMILETILRIFEFLFSIFGFETSDDLEEKAEKAEKEREKERD